MSMGTNVTASSFGINVRAISLLEMAAVMVGGGGVTVGGLITAVTKRVGVNSGAFDWATSDFAKSETISPAKKRVDIKMEIFTIAGNFLNAFIGRIKRRPG